jgi:hypothetical protein
VPIGATLGGSLIERAPPATPLPAPADDQAYIQRLARMQGPASVPARLIPYRLHRPVVVAPGTRLSFAEGVGFVYDPGPSPILATEPVGVFQLAGDGIEIGGTAEVRVRSSRPDPNLYAVLARGVRDATITNVMAQDCAHVYVTAGTEAYAQLVPSGPGTNMSARVSIIGGGADCATLLDGAGHAACVIAYCSDFVIRGCRYRNVAHGIQWWGGDADPEKDGRLENPRKCGPGRIERIDVTGSQGASVWGSMGHDILVSDCTGHDAGDVGFDSEGGIGITFLRCSQRNAKAGCFALFFENDAVRFIDCTAVQPRADQPVFRTYGKGRNDGGRGDNRAIAIEGGRFICTDAQPGTLDNAYGAIEDLTIRNAAFTNVVLRLDYRPFRRIAIVGNRFRYDAETAMSPITVGAGSSGAPKPSLTVRNNVVLSPRAAGSDLVRFVEGDPRLLNSDIADNHASPVS